jgi:hypothetical protein
MRPTAGLRDRAGLTIRRIEAQKAGIGIGLQDPGIAGEMTVGVLTGPVARIEEHCRPWSRPCERLVVAHVGP